MLNFKLITIQLLLCMSSVMFAQEICDNGIDDDNDGQIDLNDDECICDTTVALSQTTGYVCRDNLILGLEDPAAISYQWYFNGIAIAGEIASEILIKETADVEGIYQVMVVKPDGCYLSEPYEVIIPTHSVYLGEETICEGDTVFFGGFSLTFSGFFQNNGFAVDGCDSITTLTVIVESPTFGTINGQICDGQVFECHGIQTDVPGIYNAVIPNVSGCDSLITINLTEGDLNMKAVDAQICTGDTYEEYGISTDIGGVFDAIVDNPLGCDTLVTITVSVIDQPTLNLSDKICPGETYDQYGINTDIPGIYDAILSNVDGCDTLLTVELLADVQPTMAIAASICDGETYTDYGLQAMTAGPYEVTLPASTGCDTILTIDLSVEQEPTAFIQKSICVGDTYIFQDIEETTSGTYTTTYNYGGVCDSTLTVELLVTETIILDLEQTICEGETYNQFGIVTDVAGVFDTIINNVIGCDSIITVNVTVASPTQSFLTEVICPDTFYDLYDIHENTAGTYQTVIENVNGCDSTINVELSLLPVAYEDVFYSICEGDVLELNGKEYSEEEVYFEDLISVNGCDSTLAINLTVIEEPTAFREVFICKGQSYDNGFVSTSQEGVYDYIVENPGACDSTVTIQLFVIDPAEGVELEYYHTVTYGNTIDISPEFMGEGVTDITWSNGDGVEIGAGPILENFMTLDDISIQLNAIDANGCPVEARAIIDVELEIDIFIPTIFTPDGDNDNDRFQLYGGPTVKGIKELFIYDRWGNLMHSAKDVPATDDYLGWDGMFLGKHAIAGAYAYIVVFDIVTGAEKTITGTVTLVY